MKRLVLFSHFDRKNTIDAYIPYFLNGLREANCDIIFITDGNLKKKEIKKIESFVLQIITGKHNEYDFGSYKRGYIFAKENNLLTKYHELILCNDSSYAPIYPFSTMFHKMENNKVDFWGVTHSSFGFIKEHDILKEGKVSHLQSYFILLKKRVFESNEFNDFIFSIKHENNKMDVILNYEMKLTELLINAGFKFNHFIPSDVNFSNVHSIFTEWEKIIFSYHSPFLKYQSITIGNADFLKLKNLYPIELISTNIKHRFGLLEFLRITKSRYYPLISFFVLPFNKLKKLIRRFRRWILR